ncbi:MAG: hypothetical protein ABIA21_01330 [Candidatus Aenigmatarchaeota archaeon]
MSMVVIIIDLMEHTKPIDLHNAKQDSFITECALEKKGVTYDWYGLFDVGGIKYVAPTIIDDNDNKVVYLPITRDADIYKVSSIKYDTARGARVRNMGKIDSLLPILNDALQRWASE